MMQICHPLLLALSSIGLFLLASPTHGQISPEVELATLRAAEGIEVSLFVSEPLITNPAAIDVDTHGRVWVAEIQHHRRKGLDKIKVLEDTDGDGKTGNVTVFAADLFAPMSICVAGEKVYVAMSPDHWVYEDKDGDLKADGPPTKLLTGFGGHNHDHGVHSLVLGPDHKLWMSHGDGGFDVEGIDGRLVHRHDGLRLLSSGQDAVAAKLKRGRNVIVLKVVNAVGPGGAALAARSSEPVGLKAR